MVPARASTNWCSWELWSSVSVFTSSSRDLTKLSRVWAATVRKDCSFPCTTISTHTYMHMHWTTQLHQSVVKFPISISLFNMKLWESDCLSKTLTKSNLWKQLTSASQCVIVCSLAELLHSRLQAADPKPEQKSACCCSSAPLCHSCSRRSSFSCTHTTVSGNAQQGFLIYTK